MKRRTIFNFSPFGRSHITGQIEPEELLLDRHQLRDKYLEDDSKIESHLRPVNFWFLFVLTLILLSAFTGRAIWLNLIRGEYYSKKAAINSVRFWPQVPLRGIIYDKNKKPLVENIPSFNLLFVPKFLPQDKNNFDRITQQMAIILGADVDILKNKFKQFDKNLIDPVILESNINKDAVLAIETRSEEFPGIIVAKDAIRRYENGSVFFHVLGYLGRVSKDVVKNNSYYSWTDSMGVSGLEKRYEKELRGQKGILAALLNSDGAVLRQVSAREPEPGNNLVLTLNAGLQEVLYNSLLEAKIGWNGSGASGIVLDVRDGSVLALVSLPSPDNNDFSKGITQGDYEKIISNPERPLFNRVISGLYPTGSTVKPLIASAALEENIIDPEQLVDDTLGYITIKNRYNPDVTYIYRDWKAHGFVDMRHAIAVSANVYFYTIGGGYKDIKGLGIERIVKYLKLFGLGNPTNIDLDGEKSGLVPTPEWKKTVKKESWFTGDTYNVSIGQGDLTATPLQMVSAVAAIANGGTLWQPVIAKLIESPDGKILSEWTPSVIRERIADPDKLKIVREGMRGTVKIGSAQNLDDLPKAVAGKTGTAQFGTGGKTNAWFVGFAPYENPEIAAAIVVDGAGEGSSAAVPVAKDIFRWYFSQPENMLK